MCLVYDPYCLSETAFVNRKRSYWLDSGYEARKSVSISEASIVSIPFKTKMFSSASPARENPFNVREALSALFLSEAYSLTGKSIQLFDINFFYPKSHAWIENTAGSSIATNSTSRVPVNRCSEPIDPARPAPRKNLRNTASHARPCRCGTP
jgi:hypothetical protein